MSKFVSKYANLLLIVTKIKREVSEVINIKPLKLTINPKIHESWLNALDSEFKAEYFNHLKSELLLERKKYTIFPPSQSIFAAYNITPLDQVKVVIIGQDPYHGINQANGLCFSVSNGLKHPPSLQNIFKELSQEFNFPYPTNGDLTSWAKQGVLLLNATLTVRSGEANSHKDLGWQKFTDATIKAISKHNKGVIFMLWGGFAKKKSKLIDKKKHTILETGHPSPLSANRGYWFGNNHFIKANELLKARGLDEIDWKIN